MFQERSRNIEGQGRAGPGGVFLGHSYDILGASIPLVFLECSWDVLVTFLERSWNVPGMFLGHCGAGWDFLGAFL